MSQLTFTCKKKMSTHNHPIRPGSILRAVEGHAFSIQTVELSPGLCSTPSPGQSWWFNLVCPATGHRTMLHVCCQGFLGCHPALGAGVTQWIASQRALGPHREWHTRWTVHMPLPTVRIWSGQLRDQSQGRKEYSSEQTIKVWNWR